MLTLRKVNDVAQLIYYERADERGPKSSTFSIATVGDFDAMRATLTITSRSMGHVGSLLSEQDRTAQHAGRLCCRWR